MNSPVSWVGGKKALRDIIYERMPKEYGRYIEVFGGGGWVLFGRKPDTCMEVYNDFNSDLTNLFHCFRDRPLALIKELGFLPLNGRDEFYVLRKYLEKEEFTNEYLQEELELAQVYLPVPQFEDIRTILTESAQLNDVKRAAIFFKTIRLSYGSGCTSYGCQPFDIRKTFHLIWEASRRLKDTVVENKDFEELIKQYDRENALVYCDPPYYQTEGHYTVVFRKEDHYRLRDTLAACKGKWLVSYNDCEFIRELYQDFRIESVSRLNNLAQRYENGCEYAEVLISNYDTGERLRDMPTQLGLFDLAGFYGMEQPFKNHI
ncbi:MAG: DNA adenine methylase [Desulfitobacterium hafniense]|nr:DNA adenine methylase [Desulfitobacterium hafniense]